MSISKNVREILSDLSANVRLMAVAKNRDAEEVNAAVAAGVHIIGENYVQEAERIYQAVTGKVSWHFIGHLQRNKVKKAVKLFDMIETVDSVAIAEEIDRRCAQIGRIMPVLIEVNSGREEQKTGVFPEDAEGLLREIAGLVNLRVRGLMTIGPPISSPEEARPYFVATRKLFERLKNLSLPNVSPEYLSMGMSDTYRVAVEEGANIVRIGSRIFGARSYDENF